MISGDVGADEVVEDDTELEPSASWYLASGVLRSELPR